MQASNQILTVAQMRAAEDALIAGGETVDTLMQTAGRGAAEWVLRMAGHRRVTVLCGPGNNGGDGYVIAEVLRTRGLEVTVIAPLEPATGAARNARSAYKGPIRTDADREAADVLVDCLFGSGLSRPLDAGLAALLADLAGRHAIRIAVDLPSGVDSDSGRALNGNLPDYALTIALGAWKYAHWLMPCASAMGTRKLVPIGVGPVAGAARLVARPVLSAPSSDAHKYLRGLAVVVGGRMEGAGLLACAAAMRGGAGYVKLLADAVPPAAPEELVVDTQDVEIALEDPRIDAVLVGPGLGRDESARGRLRSALGCNCPVVLDADALVMLKPDMLAGRTGPCIATPHDGELDRLAAAFGIDAAGKLRIAREVAQASGMVVVAKGPDTVVAAPDGRVAIAPPASSWLSVAGTGDVLAGLVLSRLANGAAAFDAACQAVWLHGEAARMAGPAFTAGELAGHCAAALAACL